MRLADFITANVEPILVEWEAFARSIWPGAPTDPATLRDHAEKMLLAAVADMRSGQSDKQQSDKSKGKTGDRPDAAGINRVSAAHGMDRVGSGFNLPAVIAEYRALRASVIRLWRESGPVADLNDLYDIIRFNETIDQSLTEAIVAYWQHVERERTAAFEEQKERGRELRELNAELLVSSVKQHELTEQSEQAAAALRELNGVLEERVGERTRRMAEYQRQLRSLVAELSRAEQRERQQVATELHDNLAQLLAVCKMKASAIQAAARPGSPVAQDAEALKGFLGDGIAYTRTLMADLRPEILNGSDLAAAVAWVAGRMERHGLAVRVEDDGLPKPLSEEMLCLLFQCVRELLFNVVKHAGTSEATVSVERPDGVVRVIVSDGGAGFDILTLETGPSEEGGFGLFSIRERMDLLGGRMEVDSRAGRGTRVTLVAPLQPEEVEGDAVDEVEQVASSPPQADGRIRVLLVDDHRVVREGLKSLLDAQDDMVVVGEAADGEAAVELARTLRPDVVTMDHNMPKLTGVEATRRITAEVPRVRVIGLSVRGDEAVAAAMREAGAVAHLPKDGEMDGLFAAIRNAATAPDPPVRVISVTEASAAV